MVKLGFGRVKAGAVGPEASVAAGRGDRQLQETVVRGGRQLQEEEAVVSSRQYTTIK